MECWNLTGVKTTDKKFNDFNNYVLYSKDFIKNILKFDDLDMITKFMDMPIKIESCYCKESNIHGNGIFANKIIEKNEIISIYPSDLSFYSNKEQDSKISFSNRLLEKFGDNLNGCEWIWDYLIKIDKTNIHVSGCPHFIENSTYLGQLVNDSNCITFENLKKNSDDAINNYNLLSQNNTNSIYFYLNGITYIVAKKTILPNQEITVSYGQDYWTSDRKNTYKIT